MLIHSVNLSVARVFIDTHHRHHRSPQGHRFSLGLYGGPPPRLFGVATVGRPTSRHLDQRGWYEVTRLCVAYPVQGACSQLYAACARRARDHAHKCAKGGFDATGLERVERGEAKVLSLRTWPIWRRSPVFIITYTLASEPGASLRGAGWTEVELPRNSSARTGRKADGPHKLGRPMTKDPLGPKRLWVFPLNGLAREALKNAGPTPHLHQLYGDRTTA